MDRQKTVDKIIELAGMIDKLSYPSDKVAINFLTESILSLMEEHSITIDEVK